tara:strand:- start:635 stop:1195 length:561 start_codon:yes stop_codon:yes gene_type:complete
MGYKKVNRNFFKKKIQKGLPKYQSKGETDIEELKKAPDTDVIMGDGTGNVDIGEGTTNVVVDKSTGIPIDRGVDPDMYTTEGDTLSDEERALLIQKQLDMMNFANDMSKLSAITNNPKMGTVQDVVGNANLVEQGPTQNDIIMAAIESGKKVKLNKDGTIKKIKKTGGIARGKFLRQGGSTGRKFL